MVMSFVAASSAVRAQYRCAEIWRTFRQTALRRWKYRLVVGLSVRAGRWRWMEFLRSLMCFLWRRLTAVFGRTDGFWAYVESGSLMGSLRDRLESIAVAPSDPEHHLCRER